VSGKPGLILVTRQEPEASATVARLAARGREGLAVPLLTIEAVPARLPPARAVQAVILGSINAVRHLPKRFRAMPLLAVGDATAEAARAAGFAHVESAAGDARDLAALASARLDPAGLPLLLATARGAGRPLAADLRARGFRVLRRVTYRTKPQPVLPPAAAEALAEGLVGHVLFFSASPVRVFGRVARARRLTHTLPGVTALTISPAASAIAAPLGFGAVLTAARPDQDSLLALLDGRAARGTVRKRGPGLRTRSAPREAASRASPAFPPRAPGPRNASPTSGSPRT
jgi:uroporphyrinogen-III synthase